MIHTSRFEQSILATITYYDCLGMPLTSFEVYSRLTRPISKRELGSKNYESGISLTNVILTLDESIFLKKHISQENGLYFLKGRKYMAAKRVEAMKESEEKLKKLFKYRWVFLATPFLKGVFVSGSVAGGWVGRDSDIDVMLVAKKGRIWTVRLFLTLLTSMLRIRRHGRLVADYICLNHYITQDALEIPYHSLYNAQTYVNLIPIIEREDVFKRFFKQNSWINKYVWNYIELGDADQYIYEFPVSLWFEGIMRLDKDLDETLFSGMFGDFFEFFAKAFQLYFIKRNPLTGRPGGRIQAGDMQLEFHPTSKEKDILDCYNKKLQAQGLKEFYPEKDSGLK